MSDISFSEGPPETVLDPEPADVRAALADALASNQRDAVAAVAARWPRSLDAWSHLGELARDFRAYIIAGLVSTRTDGKGLNEAAIAVYGYSRETAPTIRKLAGEGTLFKNYTTQATWTKVSFFVRHPFTDVNNTLVILGIAFIVVAGAVLVRARPPGILLVYTVGTVALALASQTLGARPRFVLTAFPLVAVLGARLRPRALAPVLAVSAGLLCWLTVLTTTTVLATP